MAVRFNRQARKDTGRRNCHDIHEKRQHTRASSLRKATKTATLYLRARLLADWKLGGSFVDSPRQNSHAETHRHTRTQSRLKGQAGSKLAAVKTPSIRPAPIYMRWRRRVHTSRRHSLSPASSPKASLARSSVSTKRWGAGRTTTWCGAMGVGRATTFVDVDRRVPQLGYKLFSGEVLCAYQSSPSPRADRRSFDAVGEGARGKSGKEATLASSNGATVTERLAGW